MSEGEGRRLVTLVAGLVRGLGALCPPREKSLWASSGDLSLSLGILRLGLCDAVFGVMVDQSGGVAGTAPPMSKDPGRLEPCLFLSRTLRRTQASSRICISVTYDTVIIIITHGKDQGGK